MATLNYVIICEVVSFFIEKKFLSRDDLVSILFMKPFQVQTNGPSNLNYERARREYTITIYWCIRSWNDRYIFEASTYEKWNILSKNNDLFY